MDQSARTRFLAGVHVGVLSVESGADRPPVAVPVWYDYTPPGAIVIHADGRGEKVRLLRQAGRASLCVQDERPPYFYVSVQAAVESIEERVEDEERRTMARRYLPEEIAEQYLAASAPWDPHRVTVRLRPQRWLAASFAEPPPYDGS